MPQHYGNGKKMNGNGSKSKPKAPKGLTAKQQKNLPAPLKKAIMAKRGKM
jgi:hypothetical protein|tara:strand:- start:433 stop:582 length:150 start_codon:yes stop_codon:yes gene_type:complete